MPENKPIEIEEEVVVQVPMTGADMLKRLSEIKKDKEIKKQENPK